MNSKDKSQVLFNQLNFKQNDLNNNAQKNLYSKQMSNVNLRRSLQSDTNSSLNRLNISHYKSPTSSSSSPTSSSPDSSSPDSNSYQIESKFKTTVKMPSLNTSAQNNLANLNGLNKSLASYKIETMNHSGDVVDKNLSEVEIHRRLRNLINLVDVIKHCDYDEQTKPNGQQSKLDNNYRECNENSETDEKLATFIKSTHSSSQITNEVQNELLFLDETTSNTSNCQNSTLSNGLNNFNNFDIRKLNSLSDTRTTTKDQSSALKNVRSNLEFRESSQFVNSLLDSQQQNQNRIQETTKQYKTDAQSINLALPKNMNIHDENKLDTKINRTSLNDWIDANRIVDGSLESKLDEQFDCKTEFMISKSTLNNNEKSIDTSNLKTRSKLNELRTSQTHYQPESKNCGSNNGMSTVNIGNRRLPPPRSFNTTSGDLYVLESGQNVVYSSIVYNSYENQLNKHNSLHNLNDTRLVKRSRNGKQNLNNFEQLDNGEREENNLIMANVQLNGDAACATSNPTSVKVSKQEQTALSHQLLLANIETNKIEMPVSTVRERSVESSNAKSVYTNDGHRCANKDNNLIDLTNCKERAYNHRMLATYTTASTSNSNNTSKEVDYSRNAHAPSIASETMKKGALENKSSSSKSSESSRHSNGEVSSELTSVLNTTSSDSIRSKKVLKVEKEIRAVNSSTSSFNSTNDSNGSNSSKSLLELSDNENQFDYTFLKNLNEQTSNQQLNSFKQLQCLKYLKCQVNVNKEGNSEMSLPKTADQFIDKSTDKSADESTDKSINKQSDKQSDVQNDKQNDNSTDKSTDKPKDNLICDQDELLNKITNLSILHTNQLQNDQTKSTLNHFKSLQSECLVNCDSNLEISHLNQLSEEDEYDKSSDRSDKSSGRSSDRSCDRSCDKSIDKSLITKSKQLFINTNLNTNGLHQTNGLKNQQSPTTTTSSTASSLSLPVDMDSIDDGIHLNSVQEPRSSRDYRTNEEFTCAMKEDLAEWLNNLYDLQPSLNVNNFMDQIGTGVIICRHANNLICKAKQFYNQPDIVNGNNSQHVILNQSIDQHRRFSQCSAASSLSSSGSNNELSSLPVNINVSYQQDLDFSSNNNDSIVDSIINNVHNDDLNEDCKPITVHKQMNNNSFLSTSTSSALKPMNTASVKSPKSSPQASPKHRLSNGGYLMNGSSKLSKASSTASLNSPTRTSLSSTPNSKLNANQTLTPSNKKPLKQIQINSENRLRTYSASRIPQFNSQSTKQPFTNSAKKSTNAIRNSKAATSFTASKLPSSPSNPNRRRSLATSASSTSLLNSSVNSHLNGRLNNRQSKTNLNTSSGKTGLTSNKNLSFSSSSIYNQFANQSDKQPNNRTNTSLKRTVNSSLNQTTTKNSKSNVPLSRTQSTSSGLTATNLVNNSSNLNHSSTKPTTGNKSISSPHHHSIVDTSQHNHSTIINSSLTSNHHFINLWSERQQKLKHLSNAELIVYRDNIKSMKGMNEWHARDNVANFITACRNLFKIRDCLLFETDDLVMRKNERSFILCMLEIARIGCVFGLSSPLIIQLEQEIDRELLLEEQRQNGNLDCTSDYQTATNSINKDSEICDSAISSDCELEEHSNEPPTQIVTNDLKSLHERVVEILSLCKCPSQFPMVKVSDGKYRIGESKTLVFVRILRDHIMIRVGGGWSTISEYLLRHDPCRGCRSLSHKYSKNQAKVTISSSNLNKSFSSNRKLDSQLSCDSINSLSNNYSNHSPNKSSSYSKSNISMNEKDDNPSIMITYNRFPTSAQE